MRSFWIDDGPRRPPIKIVDVVGNRQFMDLWDDLGLSGRPGRSGMSMRSGGGCCSSRGRGTRPVVVDLSELGDLLSRLVDEKLRTNPPNVDDDMDDGEVTRNTADVDQQPYEWQSQWKCGNERTPSSILDSDIDFNKVFSVPKEDENDDVQDDGCLDALEAPPPPMKDPFVFIANRLTFLAQTIQPIIFDTSSIETGENYIKIAIDEDKTFPRIRTFDELGLITCQVNCCREIRDEIVEFLNGTEYSNIFCFPDFMSKGVGKDVWAIKFVCYKGQ